MNPQTLRDTMATLGLSEASLARLLSVDPRTVRRWKAGDVAIPGPVNLILTAYTEHKGKLPRLTGFQRLR